MPDERSKATTSQGDPAAIDDMKASPISCDAFTSSFAAWIAPPIDVRLARRIDLPLRFGLRPLGRSLFARTSLGLRLGGLTIRRRLARQRLAGDQKALRGIWQAVDMLDQSDRITADAAFPAGEQVLARVAGLCNRRASGS